MKIWTYCVVATTLAIFFQLAGFPIAESLLDKIGVDLVTGTTEFKSSTLWTALIALFAGAVISGIAIGFITKSKSENYVILPFLIAEILLFSAPLIAIITVAKTMADWIFAITLVILAPLIVGFVVAAIEFFKGTD